MKEITHYLLKEFLKKGAEDIILSANSAQKTAQKFSNNKISIAKQKEMQEITIFIAKKQKVFTTALKQCNKKAAREIVKESMQLLKHTETKKDYAGIAKGPFTYKKLQLYDKKIASLNLKEILKDTFPKKQRAEGVIEKEIFSKYLLTSSGVNKKEKGTRLYLSIRCMQNKLATGHQTAVSRTLKDFTYKQAAQTATEIAKLADTKRKKVQGKFTILFEPYAYANILESIGSAASAFSIDAGLSFLDVKKGEKVADEMVNIYDNGLEKNGFCATAFDSEGVPTRKTTIIKKGKRENYLHNTTSAKKYKTKSTGNAGILSPSPRHIVMNKGKETKEELLSQIKKGVYVTNLFYTRFNNQRTGDFSSIPRDGTFYVENGEIKHALKDIRISDNVLGMLQNTIALGKKQQQILKWETQTPCTLPHILMDKVRVTKPN